MQKLGICESSDSGSLRGCTRFERQLHFQQISNQFFMREAISNANSGQTVHLRKRAQRDHVVVSIVHGIRISRVIARVLEISLVKNDQNSLRHMLVEDRELLSAEDCARGIV